MSTAPAPWSGQGRKPTKLRLVADAPTPVGVATGETVRIRAPELATALVALFEGLTLLWMMEPEGVNLRQVTERALDGLLVNSICVSGLHNALDPV